MVARSFDSPSEPVGAQGETKRNNAGDPASEASIREEGRFLQGFALLLTERRAVVSSRGASVRFWRREDARDALKRSGGNFIRQPGVFEPAF